ncbi:thiol:disulfide interchange protein DsbA/DsbL [Methylogaea oryzae]|uniref:Thiol:disulfide interchange protein n=1 Tax=Methylogaea oryzae TaxID=1295382 RepID=A0A8D4VTN7_9GAMM|nr:thiol:disulfide interchange protein DsbA/DsbL [Methylogaea oryzae]BBL72417.1 thiol:disulfide interchange protein [Methylogaea oryzae]
MKRLGILFTALLLWSWVAVAQEYKAGVDYELITPPQPTADPAKIEVREFFWYGCPHCLDFEPDLGAWLAKMPKDVNFIRQPAIFNERWGAHAKAYFTAEALGVAEKLHADFYEAIQKKQRELMKEDDVAKFFAEHGVADADFRKAYHSFAVDTQLRQAQAMGPEYGVTGTPTVVVNGKYRLTGKLAKSYPNLIAILNSLIEQERAGAKH